MLLLDKARFSDWQEMAMPRHKANIAGKHLARHRAPRLRSLSAAQLKRRAAVFAAHASMMRNPKVTASQAAKDNGIRVRDFWVYAPKAFKKDSGVRLLAVPD